MLTSFEQVKQWITDNGFKRWVLYKDYSKTEKIIDSANFTVSDIPDKLAMTEKYLRLAGGHAYAAGSVDNSASNLNTTCEIRLEEETRGTQGVGGGSMDAMTIGQLREEITRSVRAEIEAENYKRERAEFEKAKKEFEEREAGVWGMIVNKVGPAVLGKILNTDRLVAGVDTDEPVHAAPIVPETEDANTQETEEQSPFTDEEADELFELMARFKKAEPYNYLKMIRKVVEMAEKNDSTYQMARNFLV